MASASSDGYKAVYTSDEEVERDGEEDTEAHFEQHPPSSFNARLAMGSQDGTSQDSTAVHSRYRPATPGNQQRRRTATRDVQQAIVSAGMVGCMRQAEGLQIRTQ